MNKKIILIMLITILTLLPACSKNTSQSDAQVIKTHTVAFEKKVSTSQLSGTLQPIKEAFVSFEVPGRITVLNKKEGDKVKVGEVLAKVDNSDYAAQLNKASAGLEQASAALNQVSSGAREQEKSQVMAGVKKAESVYNKRLEDFNRLEQLYNSGGVSKNDYESAKMALSVAQNDLETAKQAYSMVLEGATNDTYNQAYAVYNSALASKQQAELAFLKSSLKSPIDGTVIAKLSSEGQLVGAGTPVYKIGNIDKLKVILSVPDHEISKWKTGDKVVLKLYDSTKDGVVSNIFPTTSMSTGTVGVEVIVQNQAHDWLPGQVVSSIHKSENGDAILIPAQAVINSGSDSPYVFLAINDKAVKTPVTIGELIDEKLEITSGLKQGDQVIITGTTSLRDKMSITTEVMK